MLLIFDCGLFCLACCIVALYRSPVGNRCGLGTTSLPLIQRARGSFPSRVTFLVEVFSGFFLNCMANVRKFRTHLSPGITGPSSKIIFTHLRTATVSNRFVKYFGVYVLCIGPMEQEERWMEGFRFLSQSFQGTELHGLIINRES